MCTIDDTTNRERQSIRQSLTRLVVLSLALTVLNPIVASPQKPKASSEEESRMLGRIMSAIQDLYGGFLNEARGRYEAVVRDIEKKEYSANLRWSAYDGYGQMLLAIGEKSKAIQALTRAVEEGKAVGQKEAVESLRHVALAQAEMNDFPQAIAACKSALAMDPQNHQVLLELGSFYRRLKQYDQAREAYERVISADQKNATAYGNMGNLYLDQGQIESAISYYEKAASQTPDKRWAAQNFLNVGFRYYEGKEYEKALTLYRRALEIDPTNPLAQTDVGWSFLRLGRKAEAIEAFQKALESKPPKNVEKYAKEGLKQAKAK